MGVVVYMEQYLAKLKDLKEHFSYSEFISFMEQLDFEIINGNINFLSEEFIYYFNQIISMVNDNYLIDNNEFGTLGHMLLENALIEKKKITPTLSMCFYLEQKQKLGLDNIFNNVSFYEKKNSDMFIDDENQTFNINFKLLNNMSNDVDKYNYYTMTSILHEITHIYQVTRSENTENVFDKLALYDYQQLKNLQQGMDYGSSRTLHDAYISEFMADEQALVFMLNLSQQHPEYFNDDLIQTKQIEYQKRKTGGYGNYGFNPRQAETFLIQENKALLEEIKNNYDQAVRDMGSEHVSWLIDTNEQMIATFEEIDKKRKPLIEQLKMQGISEQGYDSYYNIYLKSLYQYDGNQIILNDQEKKGFNL